MEGRKNDTFNWGPVESKELARTPMWDVSIEHESEAVGPGFHGANAKTTHTSSAAAAKSLQSCPTLCNPIDGSPPGSPVPGILQARTLEWVASSFSNA